VVNLFERLAKGRPPPAEASKRPRSELEPAQRLLDFLQRWKKEIITERQVRIFGPGSLRDRESVIKATETLVKNGWLIPQSGPRYANRATRAWEIVHKPIVRPPVAAE
jgi:hypothetical protein